MLGGPGGDDPEINNRIADAQVKQSFIFFIVAVGLINLGEEKECFHKSKYKIFLFLAPYGIQAIMGESIR